MFNHFSFETPGDLEKSPFSETLNIFLTMLGCFGDPPFKGNRQIS